MKKVDIIKSYYEPNMGKGLPDYKVLGWESEEAQKARFSAMASNIQLDGKKVLDVGCGMGNLYEYLLEEKVNIRYTGVDILEGMIDSAKQKNLDAVFMCADIFRTNPFSSEEFNVVYSSGIFNINMGNNLEFLISAAGLFLSLAKDAVAFNLLHHCSPDREEKYYYFDPNEIRGMLLERYRDQIDKISIVEGYLRNDFTVILYK